jgi:HlyD family secretion protein
MKNKLIFSLAFLGLLAAIASAYLMGIETQAQPPVFNPASNPFEKGIYANGIIESYQSNGANVNIYPEVAGNVTQILIKEGDLVNAGTPLLLIDDSVQRLTVEQQQSQAEAAQAVLLQLKAQPRKETLEVSRAQMELAKANLKTTQDQFDKLQASQKIEPRSVSADFMDNAANALVAAKKNLDVAKKQYDLVRVGAWTYDINNQQKQYDAFSKAYQASVALLAKYTIKAPIDGVVLSLNTAVGSYISPQGVYSTYTQGSSPVIVMGGTQDYLGVRCYIDEILINRLPPVDKMSAQMSIRGTDIKIPLEFVRVQPYVSPKIALSDQRQERVDLRVLPVIFRFQQKENIKIYHGQLVDVYIGHK